MKLTKTWCLAGLILVAAFSSASCGQDEGTDGSGGKGSVLTGGSGGRGGTGGTGIGRGGDSTGEGGDAPVGATKLGRACVSDTECKDDAAPGLKCVTAKDTVLGEGAPPKGVCTVPCTVPQTASDEDTCGPLGAGALCVPFDSNSNDGYCMEGCTFGAPDIGEVKCHNRAEFSCNPALFGQTDADCTDTSDCPAGDICSEGKCAIVFTACLPSCRGDLDCAAGMYCDLDLLRGVCVKKEPVGKGLGEKCTVPTNPNDPDDCLGFCQRDSDTGNTGHCAVNCSLGHECSWNATTEKYDGLCLYYSVLTENGSAGDFGFCTPTCNCTDECQNPELSCQLLSEGALTADFRGPALCFAPDPMSKEYNQCDSGMGGAGGVGGSPGMGGAPGSGGAPE